jgi:hypothetical protein
MEVTVGFHSIVKIFWITRPITTFLGIPVLVPLTRILPHVQWRRNLGQQEFTNLVMQNAPFLDTEVEEAEPVTVGKLILI